MAYIGQDPVIGRYIIIDQISGGFNGTASGFTLAAGGQGVIPGLAQNVLLSLGGVIQQPGTDYIVSGSGITFTTAPLSGTTFFATVLGDVQSVGTPSDGTVIPASISSTGTFTFPSIVTTGATLNTQGPVRFADADSSNWVAFRGAATIPTNVTWTLPSGDATISGYVLKSNAAGTLTWGVGGGATGSGGDDVFYENSQTVTTNYTITTNKNAVTAGPITINAGVTVTIPSGSSWVVV